MKMLETRPDPRHSRAVQVRISGRWLSAKNKFSVSSCRGCQAQGAENFKFVLTEDRDREGSEEEIEALFGMPWWSFIREDVLRRCKVCGKFTCTRYGYKPACAYEHNGWGARPLPARLRPPMTGGKVNKK